MDYSKIDGDIKEDLANRIAKAAVMLSNFAYIIPAFALDDLLKTLHELKELVNDLGGHPAIDSMPM